MNQYIRVCVRTACGTVPLKNVPVTIEQKCGRKDRVTLLTDISGNTSAAGFRSDHGSERSEYIVSVNAPGFISSETVFSGYDGETTEILAEPEPCGFSGADIREDGYDLFRYYRISEESKKNKTGSGRLSDLLNIVSYTFPAVPYTRTETPVTDEELSCRIRCFQKSSGFRQSGEADTLTAEYLSELAGRIVKMKNSLYIIQMAACGKKNKKRSGSTAQSAAFFFPDFRAELSVKKSCPEKERFNGYFDPEKKTECSESVFQKIYDILGNVLPEHVFSGCGVKFSGTVYRPGDENDEVIMLQSYLKFLSYEIKEISPPVINGRYDRKTADSVRAFQKKYGLYPDGRTDVYTWNGIADLYNYFHKSLAFYKIR